MMNSSISHSIAAFYGKHVHTRSLLNGIPSVDDQDTTCASAHQTTHLVALHPECAERADTSCKENGTADTVTRVVAPSPCEDRNDFGDDYVGDTAIPEKEGEMAEDDPEADDDDPAADDDDPDDPDYVDDASPPPFVDAPSSTVCTPRPDEVRIYNATHGYRVPETVLFPPWYDALARTERDRLFQMYNNAQTMRTLGLMETDASRFAYLDERGEPTRRQLSFYDCPTLPPPSAVAPRAPLLSAPPPAPSERPTRATKRAARAEERAAQAEERAAQVAERAAQVARAREETRAARAVREAMREAIRVRARATRGDAPRARRATARLTYAPEQLPDALRAAFAPVLQRRTDARTKSDVDVRTGMPLYRHVTLQGGSARSRGGEHIGWQVQISTNKNRPLTRLGHVEHTEVGAIMAAAAFVDPSLQSQRACEAWLHRMIQATDADVRAWLYAHDPAALDTRASVTGGRKRSPVFIEEEARAAKYVALAPPTVLPMPDGTRSVMFAP